MNRYVLEGFVEQMKLANPAIPAPAQGIWNRGKELLKGERLAKLRDMYMAASDNPDLQRELIKHLSSEDMKALGTQAAAGVAGLGAATGVQMGINKGVQYAGGKLVSGLESKLLGNAKAEENMSPEEKAEARARSIGLGGDSLASRVGMEAYMRAHPGITSDESHRVNLDDYTHTGVGVMNAAALGSVQRALLKPMAANALGAQTFYHGTDPSKVPSILEHGLDPGYGGQEGGYAHSATRDFNKAQELRAEAERRSNLPRDHAERIGASEALGMRGEAKDIHPKYNITAVMGPGGPSAVPLNAGDFQREAEGRVYVGHGEPGRVAATGYALKTQPGLVGEAATSAANRLYGEEMATALLSGDSSPEAKNKILKGSGRQLLRSMFNPIGSGLDVVQAANEGAHTLLHGGSAGAHTVGGVMPVEEYNRRFEVDPDDVTRGQTGMRTNNANRVKPGDIGTDQRIHPERLHEGAPTLGQIWKNRTNLPPGAYVK